jgi:LysM repeat protein
LNFKRLTYHIIILVVTLLSTISTSLAQSDSLEVHTIKGKKYYIHIVEKGESLYAIHKKYDVPQDVIKQENPSVLDGLSIGEKVFIPVKKDVSPPSVDGNFITHKVQKKQTLYAIARIYKVKQKEIIAVNTGVENGLSEGQIIKIPVQNIKKDTLVEPVQVGSKYLTHRVKAGETLYALSKLYHTTVDSIKLINNGLSNGLKLDETIYIPQLAEPVYLDSLLSPVDSLLNDSIIKKSIYSIGLLLPFYLDENDEMVESRGALDKKGIYPKSKFAIEFYKGFLLGLDKLTTDSTKFQVYVYDTKGKDSLCTKKIIQKEECKKLDLIVGPLFYNNFIEAAEFAKNNKIPIVTPVKQNNKILLGNPFVFKTIPSKPSLINRITTLTVDSFNVDNLIAIEDNNAKEKSLIDLYIKSYNTKVVNKKDTLMYSQITKVNLTSNLESLLPHLNRDQNNVLFVPSSNSTFITNLFNYLVNVLNKKEFKNTQITLIGLEEWLKYENIDLEYFQRLNVYIPVTQYINYEDSLTNNFTNSYVEKNNTFPSKISFLGYDIATYFAGNLKAYGTVYLNSESHSEVENYSIKQSFFKTGIESGYENTNSYMLHFDNYILKKVD